MVIRLCFVKSLTTRASNFSFATVTGARRKAQKLVGSRPKVDPDGYLVDRDGNCLFFSGCKLEDLFPHFAISSAPSSKTFELSNAQIVVIELLADRIARSRGEIRSTRHKDMAVYMAVSIGLGTMVRDTGGSEFTNAILDLNEELFALKDGAR
jgi:hypothetical protein